MSVIKFAEPPSIISGAAVVGKKEHEGPMGDLFDFHDKSETFGMDTWEKSESEMQRIAVNSALFKAKASVDDIDAIYAGDLINQCTSSSYGILSFKKPYFGIYGACSTFAEGIILASMSVAAGYYNKAAVVTSSHFCSAERQFRFPIEYGGQRTPTAQRTVTGAGSVIISHDGNGPYILDVFPGRAVDKGISDVNNMGAAMAPAAIDTFMEYFEKTGKRPSDFDLILTGDLGREGHRIMCDFMSAHGYDMTKNFNDCGLLIFNCEEQDVHSGGSGCGCSASVFSSKILNDLKSGKLHNILFAATGALMSPSSLKQKLPIPAIAHLIHISTDKEAR